MKRITLALAVLAIVFALGCGSDSHTLLAPLNLTAVASGTQVNLSWTGVAGVNTYNLYYTTSASGSPLSGTKIAVGGTSYVHTGLTYGTTYYYAVTTASGGRESAASNVASVKVGISAPGGLTGTTTGTQADLSWTAVTGATSYTVYYSTTSGVTTANGTKVAGITATSKSITGLQPGTVYYFIVTASDANGESPASTSINATLPLGSPVLTVIPGTNQNTLNWTASTNATSYNIYWSTTTGLTTANGTKIGSVSGTTYAHTGLTPGTTYYYLVTAVNAVTESQASPIMSGTVPSGGGASVAATSSTGGTATINPDSSTSLTFTVPAGAVNTNTTITFDPLTQAQLPVSMKMQRYGTRSGTTASTAGGTFITAFSISVNNSVTFFNVPIGMGGSVALTFTPGTTINLAKLQSGAWVDVITAVVGANGAFTTNLPAVSLPGILTPGTYLLYMPPKGTVTVSNLGLALIGDDGGGSGSAYGSIQVVHLYDTNGNALATPTIDYLQFTNAYDLDGQALTPDGSQGIAVDGGNTVRFFSAVQTGTPIASTYTLDVSGYGGDGDSIAIMPNGDEAVVSADSSSVLALVTGVLSGTPVVAETITVPNYRDGLVISNDGATLLARGYTGLTVYAIAPITPRPGALTGTVSHSFTQIADLTGLGTGYTEDGRDGMAISPADPTRAVIVTPDNGNVTLLTGLPAVPVAGTPVASGDEPYSVSISPDGKLAVVGTSSGLLLFSGVDTGTLTMVGTVYAPSYAGASGTVTLSDVRTLGITLDGKYVVACDGWNGNLLTIPFDATGFKAPVGILNGVAVPYNDQLLIH